MKQFFLTSAAVCLALLCPASHADSCGDNCGKVTSIKKEKREGKGSGLGAIAGGVAGGLIGNQIGSGTGNTVATVGGAVGGAYAGHVVEKKVKSTTVYKVHVAMDNGKKRTFEYAKKPQFSDGDRVRVKEGRLERYSGT